MKRVLLTLFLCSMLAPAAFADIPALTREQQQQRAEQRKLREQYTRAQNLPRWGKLAEVMALDWRGGVRLYFRLAGPGECEYTLRGPQSGDDLGPVAAKGSRAWEDRWGYIVAADATIPPTLAENEVGRYHLDALCRVKVVEQTNFGPKETGRVEEVRLTHSFNLRRENFYSVVKP